MHIHLSPQRSDDSLVLMRAGDALVINGDSIDFSGIGEGEHIPFEELPHPWVSGAYRSDGVLHVTVLFPHGPNPPHHVAFPDPIIDPPDGPITLPA